MYRQQRKGNEDDGDDDAELDVGVEDDAKSQEKIASAASRKQHVSDNIIGNNIAKIEDDPDISNIKPETIPTCTSSWPLPLKSHPHLPAHPYTFLNQSLLQDHMNLLLSSASSGVNSFPPLHPHFPHMSTSHNLLPLSHRQPLIWPKRATDDEKV